MRRLLTVTLVLAVAIAAGSAHARQSRSAAAAGWRALDLGTLGGRTSDASAINAAGDVVGSSGLSAAGRTYEIVHGFLWRNGRLIDLQPGSGEQVGYTVDVTDSGLVLGYVLEGAHEPYQLVGFLWRDGQRRSTLGEPRALNESGVVVGITDALAYGTGTASIWRAGKATALGTVAGRDYSVAVDVNDRGQVLVVAHDIPFDGSFTYSWPRPFVWQVGRKTVLRLPKGTNACEALEIDRRGEVIGWCARGRDIPASGTSAPDWRTGTKTGVLWRGAAVSRLPGVPSAISGGGTIVGSAGRRGFVWRGGATSFLPPLEPGARSTPLDVNDSGQVLGTSAGHVVVWQNGRAYDLGVGKPVAINERGQVVGTRGGRATRWTPVAS